MRLNKMTVEQSRTERFAAWLDECSKRGFPDMDMGALCDQFKRIFGTPEQWGRETLQLDSVTRKKLRERAAFEGVTQEQVAVWLLRVALGTGCDRKHAPPSCDRDCWLERVSR